MVPAGARRRVHITLRTDAPIRVTYTPFETSWCQHPRSAPHTNRDDDEVCSGADITGGCLNVCRRVEKRVWVNRTRSLTFVQCQRTQMVSRLDEGCGDMVRASLYQRRRVVVCQ